MKYLAINSFLQIGLLTGEQHTGEKPVTRCTGAKT